MFDAPMSISSVESHTRTLISVYSVVLLDVVVDIVIVIICDI